MIIASGAVAIIILLTVRHWSQRRQRRHVRDLEDEHVRDAERQGIVRDVHDDLSADMSDPLLLSWMSLLQTTEEPPGRVELERIEALISDGPLSACSAAGW